MLHAKSQQSKIWLGIAAVALGSFALVGCGGGDTPSTTNSDSAGSGGGGVGGPKMGGGGGGQLPGSGTQQQQLATVPPKDTQTVPGYRRDPFKPWFNTQPPPPSVLTLVDPARIAMIGTTAPDVQPGVEIQEVPNRRVAGILTGNGVYALLDDGKVVKPGDLTDDGYQVVMINSNSVTLRKKVLSQTYTQVVPLTDAGSTYTAAAPATGGGKFGGGFAPGGGGFGPGGGGPARSGGARQGGGAAIGSGE